MESHERLRPTVPAIGLTIGWALVFAIAFAALESTASAQAFGFDFDNDGVLDEEDLCPLTTDLSGPIPTETLCEGCLGDSETVQGCNASDVLDCKPGPNHHERKFGVTPNAVDKFVRKAAWAKKCAFDPPPPPPPPETSGTASDAEELILNLIGASFTVPPAALPAETPVTFSYESPDVIGPGVLGAAETVITPVYNLAFSVQQLSKEILTLEIEVPAELTDGIYSLIRVTSDLSNEGSSTPEWVPLVGAYDSTAGLFTVELASTAEIFSIVVVTRAEAAQSASTLQTLKTYFAALQRRAMGLVESAMSMFGTSRVAARADQGELLAKGWVAYCRPELLSAEEQSLCQPGSPALLALAETMHQAAATLDGKGLGNALIEVQSPAQMVNSTLPAAYFNPGGIPSAEYYAVLMRGSDAGGRYTNPPGLIEVGQVGAEPVIDFIALHELFHAVVVLEMPTWAVRADWLNESYAAATEVWAASWAGAGNAWRFQGAARRNWVPVWRNWEAPMYRDRVKCERADHSFKCVAPYTLAELWLDADPALSFLPNLVKDFPLDPTDVSLEQQYLRLDELLQEAGGPSLPDALVSVIERRASGNDYPYCGEPQDPEDPDGPRKQVDAVDCETSPCELNETLDLALHRMSAKCFRPSVTLPPSALCPGEEILNIEFGGDSTINRYVLDGTTYEPGDTIVDAPTEFTLWALDTGIDNALGSSEGAVIVDTSCPPQLSEVRIVQQEYLSGAGVEWGDTDCGSPYQESRSIQIHSFDDGSRPSSRETFYVSNGGDQGNILEIDEVEIGPIGFGTVSLAPPAVSIVSVEGGPYPNECFLDVGLVASASASLSVEVAAVDEPNRRGFTITWNAKAGRFPALGAFGGASNKAEVTFEVEETADLFLNHDCEADTVSVRDMGRAEFLLNRVHYDSSGNELPAWTCAPYARQLGPGTYRVVIWVRAFIQNPKQDDLLVDSDFSIVVVNQSP